MIVMTSGTGTVSGTTETAVLSSEPMINTTVQGGGFRVNGLISFTGNATASTVTVKVRQGTGATGTVVYTGPAVTVAAGAVMAVPFDCLDAVDGAITYTVTATFSGAPANSGAVVATLAIANVGYQAD